MQLYEQNGTSKIDGTSKFLVFPEFPMIRTFVNSSRKLGPLRVRINRCVRYKLTSGSLGMADELEEAEGRYTGSKLFRSFI